ncbi:MAG: TonB-dependent receptor domain-containing protein [Novosphingobium sp.]
MRKTSLAVALATGTALFALAGLPTAALAQSSSDKASDDGDSKAIIVTGSRIKQDPSKSASPLEIITPQVLEQNGISSPEQLTMLLSANGSGADNLASNADVTTGAQRGTNGLSSANLRGQGSGATLILLNGRRVAAHGLSGSAVDVNQIPLAAIERVEILKDGASAIYGTDAIGGVINYITKKSFKGVGATGFVDIPEQGGGEIYSVSGIAGYGDLKTQGFNVMAAVSYRWNRILRGSDRSFVNTNQPDRGLSVDTRGTPIATIFNIGANAFQTPSGTLTQGLTLTAPNGGNAASGGINVLDLPGGAGCTSMPGGLDYDYALWAAPNNYYACAYDTGQVAVLQQPINTLTYYGRGTVAVGSSEAFVEVTGSKAHSVKSFSENQLSANTTSLPIAYPLNSLTASTYNSIFSALRSAFASNATQVAALDARYGRPIAYRWRCIPCGPREYVTDSKTLRLAGGVEGPLPFEGWDYRTGLSWARSEVSSTLGRGYFYRGTLSTGANDPSAPTAPGATSPGIVGLLNSGLLNPFSLTQSDAALAGLKAISADGTTLYGGRYKTLQADVSFSGPLFALPGGDAALAIGADYRRETYEFNGSAAAAATAPVIFNAAFDNVNALTPKKRTVKAVYGEVNLPLFDMLTITGAFRLDDYSGFGTTTNPKVTAKFQPTDWIMFRGSYSTGFRVPSFNQIFNGVTESPYSGSDIVDPIRCPTLVVNTADPNCAFIRPNIWTGGNLNLGPETSKQMSFGVVLRPTPRWMISADWWSINVDNTIQLLTLQQLIGNASLFPDRFIRDASNVVTTIDDRWINAGARRTKGMEFSLRGSIDLGRNTLSVGADGSLLLKKIEKLTPTSAYGPSLIGVFTFAGDLGVKWKHNAWLTFSNEDVSVTFTQIFRNGYLNQKLPGIANGTVTRPDFNTRVSNYATYNLTASLLSLLPNYKLTFGVKNIFNTNPPFAITYDGNTGAGSSWEPRVADPRGRSFTVGVDVKF